MDASIDAWATSHLLCAAHLCAQEGQHPLISDNIQNSSLLASAVEQIECKPLNYLAATLTKIKRKR